MKLEEIFKEILGNKKNFTGAADGEQFEHKFKQLLKSRGFTELVHVQKTKKIYEEISHLEGIGKPKAEESFKMLKKKVLNKVSMNVIKNPYSNIYNSFIFQPTGSQNFPDFIIFLKEDIIAIEIKFSKNNDGKVNPKTSRPMWNSNLPKANAIYIYGVAQKEVTFFLGSDVLDQEVREDLINYFKLLNHSEDDLIKKLNTKKNNFGYFPYVRKAYEHKKGYATYKNKDGKQTIESYFSEHANTREENVIEFLKGIK